MRTPAFAALLIIAPLVAWAEHLSPSEMAARSQRAPTAEESARKEEECALEPNVDTEAGTVTVAEVFSGPVVYLPPIRGLVTLYLLSEGSNEGTYQISAPPLLPNGGLANFDFCGVMTIEDLRPLERKDQGVAWQALRLRKNLDIEHEYPNLFPVIDRRRQVIQTPLDRYVALTGPDPAKIQERIREYFKDASERRPSLPMIRVGDTVYFPVD